jgi:predicted metal-dependent hydrolase
MSETLEVGELVYRVRRSAKRRAIGITIDRDGSLILDAPANCAWARIKALGRKKSPWVRSQLAEREMLFRPKQGLQFVTGETFYYLGRAHRLRLVKPDQDDQEPLLLYGGWFHLRTDEVARAGKHFRDWYTAHLGPWVERQVERFARRVGAKPVRVVVQDLGYRWGSSTPRGKLNFHWCVACLPPALIEYLVVHALVHQVDPQFDERFWSLVKRVLPDYRRRRRLLTELGGQYTGFPTH